jgi:hypothetical protein
VVGVSDDPGTDETVVDPPTPDTDDRTDTADGRTDGTETEGAADTVVEPSGRGRLDPDRATEYLELFGIVVLAVLSVVAVSLKNSGVSSAIGEWIARQYRPLVNAAFNLAVFALALAGLALLVRRRAAES